MRKVAVVLAMVFGLSVLGATAEAVNTCGTTPGGCIGVNEKGYLIVADGNPSNPNPGDGYVGVTSGGKVACDEQGGPYTQSTTHTPKDCDPT